ncbi:hypothetical protein GCM10028804_53820 [Larkinella terrae]
MHGIVRIVVVFDCQLFAEGVFKKGAEEVEPSAATIQLKDSNPKMHVTFLVSSEVVAEQPNGKIGYLEACFHGMLHAG